jgi:hypothetical protein
VIPPIFPLLSAAPDVAAIVDDRIYRHGRAPQNIKDVGPYITWSVVGGHSETYLADNATIDQELAQLDLWALTPQTCKALMLAVVAVLEDAGYPAGIPQDDFEEDTQLYRYMLQFHFWTSR